MSVDGASPPAGSAWRFAGHYAEMVAAMFIGMGVLALPAIGALSAIGSSLSEVERDLPALALLAMAVAMTVPMVAWMRFRGHRWRLCLEMAAAMAVPTLAAIGLLAGGIGDYETLLIAEHVAMPLTMLAAMLPRRSEYSRHGHRARAHRRQAARS